MNSSSLTEILEYDSTEQAYLIYNPSTVSSGGVYYQLVIGTHTTDTQLELSMYTTTPRPSTSQKTCDVGFTLVDYDNSKGNSIYYRAGGTKRFTKNTSATAWSHTYNSSGTSVYGVTLKHTLTINGLSFTYEVVRTDTNTTLWSYSNTFDSNLSGKDLGIITGWDNYNHYITDIKLKAL